MSVEMDVGGVSDRRPWAFVVKRHLLGPRSTNHCQHRLAVGTDASAYAPCPGGGRRLVVAAEDARDDLGRKAPVVASHVADIRTVDLDAPRPIERPRARGDPTFGGRGARPAGRSAPP